MQGKRLVYIDVLKSIAILFMVVVHTSAFLDPPSISKNSILVLTIASIGGLAAPLFVTLSGWSIQNSLMKKYNKNNNDFSLYYWLFWRFSFLFLCQLVVNLIANHIFNWNSPGVLSLLAICTLISIPLSKINLKMKLAILFILFISPLSNSYLFEMSGDWNSIIYVNSPTDFLLKILFTGTYPLFPWLSFFVLGGILRESNSDLNKKLFYFGFMTSISFMIFAIISGRNWALTQGDAVLTFFPASVGFIITANSTVLIMFIFMKRSNEKFKKSTLVISFTKIGRITLTIYLLHFIPLRLLNEFDMDEWNLIYSFIITIMFTLFWWPFSIIHERYFKKYSLEALLKYILAKKNIQPTSVRDS